jgi:chromosome partitioning protein
MSRIIAIANQKGGVGKTTTATCLAHALALMGRKVLVVDIDPQANATSGMGLSPLPSSPAFSSPATFLPKVTHTPWEGVSAIPAGHDLERLAVQGASSTAALKNNLAALPPGRFDAVLIDCPPSLGPLSRSALAAASAVIVPIQCEYYPLEGLVQLLAAVSQSAKTNPGLVVGGILLTMFDPSLGLSSEVEVEIRTRLTQRVFEAIIPRDVAVAEAPSHCRSVIDYAPRSAGARGYVELAVEVVACGIVA